MATARTVLLTEEWDDLDVEDLRPARSGAVGGTSRLVGAQRRGRGLEGGVQGVSAAANPPTNPLPLHQETEEDAI